MWYCAWSAHAWSSSKFFETFTRIVLKVYNLCIVKTDISAVLTVMSGLDPHMINKLKDRLKSYSGYFLWPRWVPNISILILAYCCSEKRKLLAVCWRCCWVIGVRNPHSIALKYGTVVSSWSCVSLIDLFNRYKSFLHDIVAHYSIMMLLYVWNLILAYI